MVTSYNRYPVAAPVRTYSPKPVPTDIASLLDALAAMKDEGEGTTYPPTTPPDDTSTTYVPPAPPDTTSYSGGGPNIGAPPPGPPPEVTPPTGQPGTDPYTTQPYGGNSDPYTSPPSYGGEDLVTPPPSYGGTDLGVDLVPTGDPTLDSLIGIDTAPDPTTSGYDTNITTTTTPGGDVSQIGGGGGKGVTTPGDTTTTGDTATTGDNPGLEAPPVGPDMTGAAPLQTARTEHDRAEEQRDDNPEGQLNDNGVWVDPGDPTLNNPAPETPTTEPQFSGYIPPAIDPTYLQGSLSKILNSWAPGQTPLRDVTGLVPALQGPAGPSILDIIAGMQTEGPVPVAPGSQYNAGDGGLPSASDMMNQQQYHPTQTVPSNTAPAQASPGQYNAAGSPLQTQLSPAMLAAIMAAG